MVLDIGTGTSILSLIIARETKARHIFAVEGSNMAVYARQIVKDNGFEKRITIINGKRIKKYKNTDKLSHCGLKIIVCTPCYLF